MSDDFAKLALSPAAAAQMIGPEMFDADSCRRWVIVATRGEPLRCPSCLELLDDAHCKRIFSGQPITCKHCGVWSNARSGTILEGSTLSDAQIVFILAMLHFEVPVNQIAVMARCHRTTVYAWLNRLDEKEAS